MSGRFLRTTGRDGNQHVVYAPELRRHVLTVACPCGPQVEQHASAVVTHAILTRAYQPPKREREH